MGQSICLGLCEAKRSRGRGDNAVVSVTLIFALDISILKYR